MTTPYRIKGETGEWEVVVGLEVHAQVVSDAKLFSGAATAFGAEGCCILHMLAEIDPTVRVINLDTGYQFAETLELRERVLHTYGIAVEFVRPDTTVAEYEAEHGPVLFGGRLASERPKDLAMPQNLSFPNQESKDNFAPGVPGA